MRTYVYRMGAEVCGYRPIVPAGAASPVSARSLFEADQGVDRVAVRAHGCMTCMRGAGLSMQGLHAGMRRLQLSSARQATSCRRCTQLRSGQTVCAPDAAVARRPQISFKFGRYTDTSCMPATAIRALKATRVRCVRLTPNLDGRASTYVQAYGGAGKAGELLPSCSGGTYRVVLGLPKQLGQYQCYITLNDGTPERLLAELRVSPP